MAVATHQELRAASKVVTEGRIKLAKSLRRKDLFLSHSQQDASYVPGALGLLEQHGARVYVDLEDAGIKGLSGTEIAVRLGNAVRACRRLVVVVTEETSTSRWIPWEMGLADGVAGTEQVALLPLRPGPDASVLWLRQKYFDLYARIERVTLRGDHEPCWAVRDPSTARYWRLGKWVERTAKGTPARLQ